MSIEKKICAFCWKSETKTPLKNTVELGEDRWVCSSSAYHGEMIEIIEFEKAQEHYRKKCVFIIKKGQNKKQCHKKVRSFCLDEDFCHIHRPKNISSYPLNENFRYIYL
jgi:hypothetical protein